MMNKHFQHCISYFSSYQDPNTAPRVAPTSTHFSRKCDRFVTADTTGSPAAREALIHQLNPPRRGQDEDLNHVKHAPSHLLPPH